MRSISSESSNSPDVENTQALSSVKVLTEAFFRSYPRDAARKIESLTPADTAQILASQPTVLRQRVWLCMTPTSASQVLPLTPDEVALELLMGLDAGPCASLLSRLDDNQREHYLGLMSEASAHELRELLDYPPNCAGYMMDTRTLALSMSTPVAEALTQLKTHPAISRRRIYTLDNDMRLHGQVDLERLVTADKNQSLGEVSTSIQFSVAALDPREDVAEKLQKNAIDILPVVDVHHRLLGVIRGSNAIEALKENIAADLQTMVGASRDEQALSTVFLR